MIKITDQLEFHLSTKNTSYIMKILDSKHIGHLYYGRKIREKNNYDHLLQNYTLPLGNATDYSTETKHFTLDSTPVEVGSYGKGDYKQPSIELSYKDGSTVSDFLYQSYDVYDGKRNLEGLPSSFANEDSAKTLEITLYDSIVNVSLVLSYSVFYEKDIITRHVKVINDSKEDVMINKIMSCNIDFQDSKFDLITLDGKWIKERHINKKQLSEGIFMIDSKRGVSSSTHNPFMCLSRPLTTESNGECYGFSLMYSGNHQGSVEVNPHQLTRLQMGINPFDFMWTLKPTDIFQSPEVVMTFSSDGYNGMSHNYHDFINEHIVALHWQKKSRPILINNWEATYFDFDEKKIVKLAKEAHKLGIELFVLDDGWFGKRNDDTTSLGDWFENKKKLPNGLEGLSKKINDIGMDFGIWVEPEMISVESELYKKHPDWAIKNPNREVSFGRNQLILDLCNDEVVEYLFDILSDVFKRSKVKYVKWDMNRNFSDAYSNVLPSNRQKELNHRYMLGLYNLLEKLTKSFPEILFESCASGGNRFDMGMLYYMPQTWTSDNTDALERQMIQYGTSMVYPISTMGAHVSAIPSHQVLRNTPIETRYNVAIFGLLGYELDVTKLSNFEKKVIIKQINYYKKHRQLLQYGRFNRLNTPFDSNITTWMVSNKTQHIIGNYQKLQVPNEGFESIRLVGLNPDKDYEINSREQYFNVKSFGDLINQVSPVKMKENGIVHQLVSDNYLFEANKESFEAGGDELMYAGLKLKHQFIGTGYNESLRHMGDFGSRVYLLEEKN